MTESGKNGFIGKKTYEIAYALWQIGIHANERVFADKLSDKAIELVVFAADGNYQKLLQVADSLQAIIKFAVDVNCITVGNAAILAREIGNLKSAIPGDDFAGIDLAGWFSQNDFPRSIDHPEPAMSDVPADTGTALKAAARQSAILEEIRRIGNCRFSDIQAILPETSERTIRYDLESLVNGGLVERVGTGGRAVFYRLAGMGGSGVDSSTGNPVTNPPDLRYT